MLWMHHDLFHHLHIIGQFSCFHFGPIQIKLLCTIAYSSQCGYNFSFIWDKCPRKQLLGHMVSALLGVYVFRSGCTILHSHQQWMRDSDVTSPPAFGIATIFYFSCFNRCSVISLCGFISLITSDIKYLSYIYFPCVYSLQ